MVHLLFTRFYIICHAVLLAQNSYMIQLKRFNTHVFLLLFALLFAQFSFGIEKIKGISFVASSTPIGKKDIAPIISINANWVTLMPFGFVSQNGKVKYNSKWQWWGERTEGLAKTVELCQKSGLKIMIKPQIWMMHSYTGDLKYAEEEDWVKFENSYKAFILDFLDVAIKYKVDLFCIGTEWREFVKARPNFWKKLIYIVRAKYKGEITYAANWDDYETVSFWDKLDVVGIDGYFPISYSAKPTLKELVAGWTIHKNKLALFAKKIDKQILLTEIGYRSMTGATMKPWEHSTSGKYSEEIQNFAYKALFKVLWNEKWFRGMFIWKWYHNHIKQGGEGNIDFTPQNKPAEKTIRAFWGKK